MMFILVLGAGIGYLWSGGTVNGAVWGAVIAGVASVVIIALGGADD